MNAALFAGAAHVAGFTLFLFTGVGEDRYTGPDTCGDDSNYRRVFEWPSGREDCAVGTVAEGMVVTAMGCMNVGTGGLLHSAGECPEYVGNLTGKHVDDPLIS